MTIIDLSFYILLFVVAFLYASVGHGGASGYLAIMALYGIAPTIMKPTALLLNIFVSAIAFIQFYNAKHFKPKIFWPLAIASIPLAFLGGQLGIKNALYNQILGVVLLIPITRFLLASSEDDNKTIEARINLPIILAAAAIGFLSGLIGIGGGIILSPILLLLRWTDQKQTAAIAAPFIFFNSLAGLAGQLYNGIQFDKSMIAYTAIAIAGGLLGSRLGALKFKQNILKIVLALVLTIAALKLIFSSIK